MDPIIQTHHVTVDSVSHTSINIHCTHTYFIASLNRKLVLSLKGVFSCPLFADAFLHLGEVESGWKGRHGAGEDTHRVFYFTAKQKYSIINLSWWY